MWVCIFSKAKNWHKIIAGCWCWEVQPLGECDWSREATIASLHHNSAQLLCLLHHSLSQFLRTTLWRKQAGVPRIFWQTMLNLSSALMYHYRARCSHAAALLLLIQKQSLCLPLELGITLGMVFWLSRTKYEMLQQESRNEGVSSLKARNFSPASWKWLWLFTVNTLNAALTENRNAESFLIGTITILTTKIECKRTKTESTTVGKAEGWNSIYGGQTQIYAKRLRNKFHIISCKEVN